MSEDLHKVIQKLNETYLLWCPPAAGTAVDFFFSFLSLAHRLEVDDVLYLLFFFLFFWGLSDFRFVALSGSTYRQRRQFRYCFLCGFCAFIALSRYLTAVTVQYFKCGLAKLNSTPAN